MDNREDTPNWSYRKLPLLLKPNRLMFTRSHTLTSCSLPWYFRSFSVYNAFATNVSYSVGHLTSVLEYEHRTPEKKLLRGEPKAGISRVSRTKVHLPTQTVKNYIWILNKTVTSQGKLFPGSNLERAASVHSQVYTLPACAHSKETIRVHLRIGL